MPTRFRNASTVGSPQYPAAIAAGIRRGQEPAGIIAKRRIAKGRTWAAEVGIEFSTRLVLMEMQITGNVWNGDSSKVVEKGSAAY
jgi:hypothetical protein